jgi:release factor glutamine methyltransferase
MNIHDWLTTTTATFDAAGIDSSRLDTLILLEDAVGKERAYLLAQPDAVLDSSITDHLDSLVVRRCNHEPMAYIRGKAEFYGREFNINEFVMVPRPESETIIDLLKAHAPDAKLIIDVGTGSGALAITSKKELPKAHVIATDLDEQCLKLARSNAKKLIADVEFAQSDLLESIPAEFFDGAVILANLPYVPNSYEINRAATHEPRLAIFGGADGLELYRQMFNQIDDLKAKPMYVFTEALLDQHSELSALASAHGYTKIDEKGLVEVFRL